MPIKGSAPPKEQEQPYRPPGANPLVFEKFNGINTTTSRPGVPEDQMAWSSGFFQIGPRFLRTFYGIGTAIWTAPAGGTITFFNFANIGATPIMVGVHSDGGIWQVNTNTLVATRMAADGTILNPSRASIGMTQWGNQYVIIVANQTNGYWIWDGTTFYSPGSPAPGGGTVPTGISGSTIETYAGRVWVGKGATIMFSAPGSFVDFATGDGGGSFTSSDSFLRVSFTQLLQTNGFLYLIADSSVNYISGVQTGGSPLTTTFTNQNADPEVGTPWPGTVDVFGRNILFANAFGAHVSYGAAVTKISEELDGVYNTAPNFGGLTPSAAKAIIFGKKVWILLLPIIDPLTGQQTNKLFVWNSKKWFPSDQDVSLIYIQHQEIASQIYAFGTDGLAVYPLFTTPSDGFTKTVQSKLWDDPLGYDFNKTVTRLWGLFIYYNLTSETLTFTIDNEVGQAPVTTAVNLAQVIITNASDAAVTVTNASAVVVVILISGSQVIAYLEPTAVGQQGILSGVTMSTNSPDMALISLKIQPDGLDYRG